MAKPIRMRISFDETNPQFKLKKQRTDIQFKILKSKTRAEGNVLQKELARINKKIRGIKMELHHINCQDTNCAICFADASKLEKYLCKQTGTENRVDHLGEYHKWLMDNGINPETEFGWFTSDAFNDENIQNYIAWYRE